MNSVLDNLKIYCAYHDKKIYNEYNLYESNIIKPYYLLDENVFDKWYIDINIYLNEFQLMLYIYDNNIKSDYVGFCHYRRFWNYIDSEFIKNNGIYFYMCNKNNHNIKKPTFYEEINAWAPKYFLDKLEEFFKLYYKNLLPLYYNIINSKIDFYDIYTEMFIVKWDIFQNIVNMIKQYLFYCYGNKLINFNNIMYLLKNNSNLDNRTIGYFIEILIMILFNILYQHKINLLCSTNSFSKSLDIILNYTGKENIDSWVKKQYSIGIQNIFIINKTNNNIKNLNHENIRTIIINDELDNIHNIFDVYKYNTVPVGFCENYIIFNNEEYLSKNEIIQYQNELWNNKKITNKKIIKS